MNPTWSIAFWYQLNLRSGPISGKGIIVSYQGIVIFLNVDDHVIGINDGKRDYLGPIVTGLEAEPWICFGLTKDISTITLYLDAVKAIEISDCKIVQKIEHFHARASSAIKIIEQDLSSWVDKRTSMFKLQQITSPEYRVLSIEEQEIQLLNSIRALEDLLQAYNGGKTHFMENILSNLRSLVCYKSKNKTYDPLLLRVAAFKKMALPVYIIPADIEVTRIPDTLPVISALGMATLEPRIPNVKKADFQEFLEKPTFLYYDEFITPLDLIEIAATTQAADSGEIGHLSALNRPPRKGLGEWHWVETV